MWPQLIIKLHDKLTVFTNLLISHFRSVLRENTPEPNSKLIKFSTKKIPTMFLVGSIV